MSHYHSSLSELLVLLTPLIQMAKCLPTVQETQVRSLDREDPLEKEVATHSSTLAWKIPWTEELGGLQSMGSQRVRHDWVTSHTHTHTPLIKTIQWPSSYSGSKPKTPTRTEGAKWSGHPVTWDLSTIYPASHPSALTKLVSWPLLRLTKHIPVWGLCPCCSLCLECSSLKYPRDFLLHQTFTQSQLLNEEHKHWNSFACCTLPKHRGPPSPCGLEAARDGDRTSSYACLWREHPFLLPWAGFHLNFTLLSHRVTMRIKQLYQW